MTPIHPMNKTNQTEIQIMNALQNTDCPLEPIAAVEDAAAQHRTAYAALKYRRQLICWAERVIAYKPSQRYRHNRRVTTVKRSHIRGLLGIAALFEVDKKEQYVHLGNRFDIFGWRSTSLAEICDYVNRLSGSRRQFTEKQAARSLDELCRLGLVERKTTFSLEQFPVPLAVLFRADRVLEAIKELSSLRKQELKTRMPKPRPLPPKLRWKAKLELGPRWRDHDLTWASKSVKRHPRVAQALMKAYGTNPSLPA